MLSKISLGTTSSKERSYEDVFLHCERTSFQLRVWGTFPWAQHCLLKFFWCTRHFQRKCFGAASSNQSTKSKQMYSVRKRLVFCLEVHIFILDDFYSFKQFLLLKQRGLIAESTLHKRNRHLTNGQRFALWKNLGLSFYRVHSTTTKNN